MSESIKINRLTFIFKNDAIRTLKVYQDGADYRVSTLLDASEAAALLRWLDAYRTAILAMAQVTEDEIE